MKKIVSIMCVLAITLIAGFGGLTTAFAGTYEEECDLVFLKAFEQLLSDESIMTEVIEIKKDPIYDVSLELLGYVYTMDIDSDEGFALIINTNGIFEITEMFLNAENPYGKYEGLKVYANVFFYLIYQDGQFIETATGAVLDGETIERVSEKAFSGGGGILWTEQETIYYTNRTVNSYNLALWYPTNLPFGTTNGCTPVAGANIIHYYTRFFPNLIPDFEPGYDYLGYYLYYQSSSKVDAVTQTLANYMGTNVGAAGTTIAGFKTGMTRFCSEKGRNISYNSCMQSSKFNYESAKQRLTSGLPLVLFVDTFTVANIVNNSTEKRDGVGYTFVNATHTMAGFGYQEITYTLTNGQTRNDKYIAVASGLGEHTSGYFNTNLYTQIDDAYGINIY